MLEAVIIASLALRAWIEAAVPAVLLLVNAILGFIQEARAAAALDALTDRLKSAPALFLVVFAFYSATHPICLQLSREFCEMAIGVFFLQENSFLEIL